MPQDNKLLFNGHKNNLFENVQFNIKSEASTFSLVSTTVFLICLYNVKIKIEITMLQYAAVCKPVGKRPQEFRTLKC